MQAEHCRLLFQLLLLFLLILSTTTTLLGDDERSSQQWNERMMPSDEESCNNKKDPKLNNNNNISSRKCKHPWRVFLEEMFKHSSSLLAGISEDPVVASCLVAADEVDRERRTKTPGVTDGTTLTTTTTEKKNDEPVKPTTTDDDDHHDENGEGFYKKDRKKLNDDNNNEYDDDLLEDDAFVAEGAKLIAGSFGLLRASLGAVGDGIRVLGDTTAGFTGSSIKVVGAAVKGVSVGLDTLGKNVEGNTSTKPLDESNPIDGTRYLTGKSIRLVGNVVKGVAESVVMVGHAAEALTSSTVGVAEDAVRFAEGVTYSVSNLLLSGEKLEKKAITTTQDLLQFPINHHHHHHRVDNNDDDSLISFGVYDDDDITTVETSFLEVQEKSKESSTFVSFFTEIMSEKAGVKSMAPELLGVMVVFFIISVRILRNKERHVDVRTQEKDTVLANPTNHYATAKIKNEVAATSVVNGFGLARKSGVLKYKLLFRPFFSFLRKFSADGVIRLMVSRHGVIFFMYFLGWLYLAHLSELRSRAIVRNAEMQGFRKALESFDNSEENIFIESAMWLNLLLSNVWRVYDIKGGVKLDSYPNYVINGMKGQTNIGNRSLTVYGGLEPYISKQVGSVLVDLLESTAESKPNDVAYISLDTLTLGSSPPIIRAVQPKRFNKNTSEVSFSAELDLLLNDLNIILAIRLSSLEKALIPTTKISINAVDVLLPLDFRIKLIPDYPFIDTLNISFQRMPQARVRITPLSDTSGLKGVDLGSLPVINTWIQNAIDAALLEYVSPRYLSLNVSSLLSESNFEPVISQESQDFKTTISSKSFTTVAGASLTKKQQQVNDSLSISGSIKGGKSSIVEKGFTSNRNRMVKLSMEQNKPLQHDEDKNFLKRLRRGFIENPLKTAAPLVLAIGAATYSQYSSKESK